MPSLGNYKIYDTVKPCTHTGEKLKETINKLIQEHLSEDGRELNFNGCCVGPNGMNLLALDERLSKLKRLNLAGNKIGDEGAKMLASSPNFAKLNWLELGGNEIGPEGLDYIVKSRHLQKLTTLNLYRNDIGGKGAALFANENTLEKLEEVDLAQNEISDEGIIAFSQSKRFPNLVACYMDNNFAGAKVVEGDRLLELLAGEVVVDVPAPATGRLAEKRVAEGDIVTPRQVLGVIEADDEPGCRGEPPTQ
ncbi:MAG: hypothetical protein ACE5EK_03815 [Nitrospinales bacterium]